MNTRNNYFMPLRANESAQFDSLRGASAIAVVVGHTNQFLIASTYDGLSGWLGLLAQAAVMVFFVLSGFLICKSISGNIAKHQGHFSLVKYTGDRFIRIWPPLVFSLALMAFLYHLAPAVFPSGSNAFLAPAKNALARTAFTFDPTQALGAGLALNGFFTDTPSANGALWSLSIEVWYYLMAAIIATPRGWWKVLSAPLIGALFVVGWNNDQFFYYLPVWWAGYGLSYLHNRRLIPPAGYLWLALIGFAFAATAFGVRWMQLESTPGAGRAAWHCLIFFNISVGLTCCSALALLLRGRLTIPTIFKPAASYSYTLYIIHVPILLIVFGCVQRWIGDSPIRAGLISLLAVLGIIGTSRLIAQWVENRRMIRSIFRSARV